VTGEWWGKDFTGRFASRPFYTRKHIEDTALDALSRCGAAAGHAISHPIDDEALEMLVEFLTDNFDQSADTGYYGIEVDGFTVFSRYGKPSVVLNRDLSAERYRRRRRFTIGHELGHVILHQPLYERDDRQLDLLVQKELVPVYCAKRDIERSADWCEWQAGYFSGALLMPRDAVHKRLVERSKDLLTPVASDTAAARVLADIVAQIFDVSRDAARVRLASLGLVVPLGTQQLGEQIA
jgi:Zn-dependent peptidase ImmA (M78 family)